MAQNNHNETRMPEILGGIAKADHGEWPRFDLEHLGKTVYTHSWDTSWRIELHGVHRENEPFDADWTDSFPRQCFMDVAYIFHNSSPIHSVLVVYVNQGNVVIANPTEKGDGLYISKLEDNIGKILSNDLHDYHSCMNQAGIQVSDDTISVS